MQERPMKVLIPVCVCTCACKRAREGDTKAQFTQRKSAH